VGEHPPVAHDDALVRLREERSEVSDQVASLTREFDGIVAAAESVATDDEHDPEGHTIAFERQQVAGLVRAARMHLSELDDAIGRVESGRYGACDRCGRAIPAERLAALPATRTCIACAT